MAEAPWSRRRPGPLKCGVPPVPHGPPALWKRHTSQLARGDGVRVASSRTGGCGRRVPSRSLGEAAVPRLPPALRVSTARAGRRPSRALRAPSELLRFPTPEAALGGRRSAGLRPPDSRWEGGGPGLLPALPSARSPQRGAGPGLSGRAGEGTRPPPPENPPVTLSPCDAGGEGAGKLKIKGVRSRACQAPQCSPHPVLGPTPPGLWGPQAGTTCPEVTAV